MTTVTAIRSKTKPWAHQVRAFEFAFDRDGACLFLVMGTGKSKVAIDLAINRGSRKILILCPLSVVAVWPTQFERHAADQVQVVALNTGSVKKKQETARAHMEKNGDEFVAVVVNYDSAWRAPLDSWLCSVPWDLLILDESHRLKSPSGRASMFVSRLARAARTRLALTGTPMPHSPLDIYAQMRAVDPSVFPKSYFAFRNRYAVMGGFENRQVVRYQNLEELHAKVYSAAFRVGSEVLDLPEAMHERRDCTLSPKGMRIYRQMAEEFRADLDRGEITAANAMVRLLRLQQITSGYLSEERVDDEKERALLDLLDDMHGEPVVVFCRFRSDLDAVARVCRELKIASGELSGRTNTLDDWQAGGSEVLAVQIQSGGLGVDLTRARYAIYFSLGFSLGDYEQSLARIHRPGQERPVTYYHLIATGTVDEIVYRALDKRRDLVESVLAEIKVDT